MKQKEERDLENALAWDGKPGDMEAALEAIIRVEHRKIRQYFLISENYFVIFELQKDINKGLIE
jgi:hypothetical protein